MWEKDVKTEIARRSILFVGGGRGEQFSPKRLLHSRKVRKLQKKSFKNSHEKKKIEEVLSTIEPGPVFYF